MKLWQKIRAFFGAFPVEERMYIERNHGQKFLVSVVHRDGVRWTMHRRMR